VLLFAFRAIVRSSVRSYFSLPRRQEAHPATLPVDQIYLESRPSSGRPQG
jgi:hypothetical protein